MQTPDELTGCLRQWWMRLGDARIWINVDEAGGVRVDVERGFYEPSKGETTT